MPVNGYFDTIFGVSGDLTAVPDAVQMDGTVSFTQGYGADYELPVGNPSRLVINRAQANQLWYYVTSALQQYQQKGVPPFITTTMNGGSPFSYSQGDRVVSGGVVYTSLVNTNTTTPPGASWGTGAPVPLGGTGVTSLTAYAPIFGGTTSTGAVQSGTVGTSGQILTSNGAGALPTFQSTAAIILAAQMANLPIGSWYYNRTNSTNPATLLGFGTWVAVTDVFPVAHGSTYTSTGGAATVTLSASNIPTITSTITLGNNTGAGSNTYVGASNIGGIATTGGTTAGSITSNNTGSSAFSIIPPYQAVYIWERTA